MLCLSIPAAGADDAEDANADIDIEAEHWVFVPEAVLGQNALTPPYPVPTSKVVIIGITLYNLENSKAADADDFSAAERGACGAC